MKIGEQITLNMASEVEFSPDVTSKFNAWAALDAIEDGMNQNDVMLIYGITPSELEPYKASWERVREETYA
jgi:hypothetical protein